MGRKRKSGKRYANGRLSRNPKDVAERRKEAFDMQAQEAMALAIDARQRLFGLSREEARDQRAGTFIGRLCLLSERGGGITQLQYDALCAWEESARENSMVISGPKDDAAFDLNRVHGRAGDEDGGQSIRVRARHRAAELAIMDKQAELRGTVNLFAALYECVQRDREHFHLLGDLRVAANALARHYGLEDRRAA